MFFDRNLTIKYESLYKNNNKFPYPFSDVKWFHNVVYFPKEPAFGRHCAQGHIIDLISPV